MGLVLFVEFNVVVIGIRDINIVIKGIRGFYNKRIEYFCKFIFILVLDSSWINDKLEDVYVIVCCFDFFDNWVY